MDTREALIALNLIEGVGPVRARSLLEHFGDAPKILTATAGELRRVRGIGEEPPPPFIIGKPPLTSRANSNASPILASTS